MGIRGYSSRDVMRTLAGEGWELRSVDGSHHNFRHPTKPGRVTVPHPVKDMSTGTLRSVFRQAGWDWKKR